MDGEGQHLVEPLTLIAYQVWLEQQLRGPEPCWPHLWNTRLRDRPLLPQDAGITDAPQRQARQLTSSTLPSGKVYCTFSVSRASSFCGLMDR